MKSSVSPMNGRAGCVFPGALQCRATSKRTGCRCRAPAVKGWQVCRFHGARGGQPSGPSSSRYVHGRFSAEARATRLLVRQLRQSSADVCAALSS